MTRIRIAHQIFFLGLFLLLLLVADAAVLGGFPVALYLEVDPLVALATALATHSVYKLLGLSLVVVILTLLVGRAWCNWVCPLGTLFHLAGWLGFRRRDPTALEQVNRYRPAYGLKYALLLALLVAASGALLVPRNWWLGRTLTDGASLQIGLLDPLSLLNRTMAMAVFPAVNEIAPGAVFAAGQEFYLGWIAAAVFLVLLALNLLIPRWFCRVLCPLGALLAVFGRWSLWRIDRDPARCIACARCAGVCEGAADPDRRLRLAECTVCLKCVEVCPTQAIGFRLAPSADRSRSGPEVTGRRLILAGAVGLLFYPLVRPTGTSRRLLGSRVIRPPGALAEEEFLKRCIKCGACLRACPTNILQLAFLEAGLEGLWSPIMMPRLGYCKLDCVRCGQVCPTGAIREITLDEKHGWGAFAAAGPVRVGTAFIDRGRCLPWAMATECRVCEEVCPVSPKAIYSLPAVALDSLGNRRAVRQPQVDPHRCIGCGACEHACPVKDQPAISITAIGETRDRDRGLVVR